MTKDEGKKNKRRMSNIQYRMPKDEGEKKGMNVQCLRRSRLLLQADFLQHGMIK